MANVDYVCFHCPFAKQVEKSFMNLLFHDLKQNLSTLTDKNLREFVSSHKDLAERKALQEFAKLSKKITEEKLYPGLEFSRLIGNIYTGSLYLCLISLLFHKNESLMRGKKILMYSYGSGAACSLFTLKVLENYSQEKIISPQSLRSRFKTRTVCSVDQSILLDQKREQIYNKNNIQNGLNREHLWDRSYYLSSVDKKGKRIYLYYRSEETLPVRSILVDLPNEATTKFRNLTLFDKRKILSEKINYSHSNLTEILQSGGINDEQAQLMIENCIGQLKIPLGLAQNFSIN